MPKKKTRKERIVPSIESPTWDDVQRMAEVVLNKLGGPPGAAQVLSGESFYTLSILASLNLDERKKKAFVFGKQYLT